MDAIPQVPITVQITSTSPDLVQAPATVTIPAGTNTTPLDLWISQDQLISPPIVVAILAHVANWDDDAGAIIIADDESTNLFLSVPDQVLTTAGTIPSAGEISLGGYLPTNLVVTLSSDNPSTVQVTNQVTIEAGQSLAFFDITVLDDHQPTNPRNVSVKATAPGFGAATAAIQVFDANIPSPPTNPSPAHLAMHVGTDPVLQWQTQLAGSPNIVTFDVFFGTNPVPGQAEFQGNTATNQWPLHALALTTTYYWQIVARVGDLRIPGPVWQFTTVGLDHFAISNVASPQWLESPFQLTVTAMDESGNPTSSFSGSVALQALAPTASASSIVISEVDTGTSPRVEFANVSSREMDLSGWQIVLYDWTTWPAPKTVFSIPNGSLCAVGDLFQVRKTSARPSPDTYPIFNLATNLFWNLNPNENPVAVLLLDSASNMVDFFCAVDADPSQITNPLSIPGPQWSGLPVPANLDARLTYQRIGSSDHNNSSDWILATNTIGRQNLGLVVPFYDLRPLSISPNQLLAFTNGLCSESVTFHEPAASVFFVVDDGAGHRGTGNVFAVGAPDNISVSIAVPPGRKTVANPFTYQVTVSNTGPSAATGVVVLDNLPAGADFLSATSTQGTPNHLPGAVVCELGTINGQSNAILLITVLPQSPGLFTNRAAVSRLEPEIFTADDTASLAALVVYPVISIADAGVVQSRSASTNLTFKLQLSNPSQRTISVSYQTSDGSALAGSDYAPASGVVAFAPGTTNLTIPVTVYANTLSEPTKNLFLNLAQATNAVTAQSFATGSITNNNPNSALSISDATVLEGDAGTTNALFQLSLSAPSGKTVSLSWNTAAGTAVPGFDYLPGSGSISFAPGQTNQFISVAVLANTWFQPNRAFYVNLSYPANTYFVRSQGLGTILDDDAWRLHHFTWSVLAPTQYLYEPFLATLTAQNALNQTFTNFGGVVAVHGSSSNRLANVGADTTRWDVPFGAYHQDCRLQVIYPAAQLAAGAGRITGLALEVQALPAQVLSNWTIRLRHTPLAAYDSPLWETNWTIVYQAAQALVVTGLTTFNFRTPFDYNGTDNLMVDYSFNNSSSSSNGLCRASTAPSPRSIYYQTDGGFGDPLQWSGDSNPAPLTALQYPNARFMFEAPASITPLLLSNFVNGVWTGPITCNEVGAAVVLHALDQDGHSGDSNPFDVIARDSDGDGIPDWWMLRYFGHPTGLADDHSLPGDDADGDGLTNLQEYLAGTDPRDPASTIKIQSITLVDSVAAILTFTTGSNTHYQLQYSTNLNSGRWWPATAVQPGNGGLTTVINRFSSTTPARFFRLIVTP